ncbi:hypothetical protein GF339_17915, partial [candidate division KSB3 bacterium]|nr:hypothetical protein [candidate division KSB3 bacterium]MBD3326465.1 hypothetical protein [candidate division KSB3 bacterium]
MKQPDSAKKNTDPQDPEILRLELEREKLAIEREKLKNEQQREKWKLWTKVATVLLTVVI